jgi:hypothetical protein
MLVDPWADPWARVLATLLLRIRSWCKVEVLNRWHHEIHFLLRKWFHLWIRFILSSQWWSLNLNILWIPWIFFKQLLRWRHNMNIIRSIRLNRVLTIIWSIWQLRIASWRFSISALWRSKIRILWCHIQWWYIWLLKHLKWLTFQSIKIDINWRRCWSWSNGKRKVRRNYLRSHWDSYIINWTISRGYSLAQLFAIILSWR